MRMSNDATKGDEMTKITITEALAEIKTLKSRIAKRQEGVMPYLARDSRYRDPMEDAEGGSKGFVRRERQAVRDLESRLVALRTAIQGSNLVTKLTISDERGSATKTVSEWLSWRKEISAGQKAFLAKLTSTVQAVRAQAMRSGQQVTDKQETATGNDILICVSESDLARDSDVIDNLLGQLDGKLSLLNATTLLDV